ncbi:MAG TPA: hypothetical protein VL098_12705 [Flavipsychrobacter sp.]|nr:hypothetical protein [Flavipsychrobacter sp.]
MAEISIYQPTTPAIGSTRTDSFGNTYRWSYDGEGWSWLMLNEPTVSTKKTPAAVQPEATVTAAKNKWLVIGLIAAALILLSGTIFYLNRKK